MIDKRFGLDQRVLNHSLTFADMLQVLEKMESGYNPRNGGAPLITMLKEGILEQANALELELKSATTKLSEVGGSGSQPSGAAASTYSSSTPQPEEVEVTADDVPEEDVAKPEVAGASEGEKHQSALEKAKAKQDPAAGENQTEKKEAVGA